MGSSPKTKADYDREIASQYSWLATYQTQLESIKTGVRNGNLPKCCLDHKKGDIARCKARIAELKAKKRTIK